MKITVLFHPQSPHRARIEAAVRDARVLQSHFKLALEEASWLPEADEASAKQLRDHLRVTYPSRKVVAVVDAPLDPDWVVVEYRDVSVITTRDWERLYQLPVGAHLLYQLASAFTNFAADLSDEQIVEWAHRRNPRGCLFDWFDDKRDLHRAMTAATLCGEHREKLRQRGLDEAPLAAIRALLETVRKYVIGEIKPVPAAVFIGHAHSKVWESVRDWVAREVGLPIQEFNLEGAGGIATTERIMKMLDDSTAAILVMTAEEAHANGEVHARPNVIHEIGLFQGRLGLRRAIVLRERGVASFSNIDGLTVIEFAKDDFANSTAAQQFLRLAFEREGLIAG